MYIQYIEDSFSITILIGKYLLNISKIKSFLESNSKKIVLLLLIITIAVVYLFNQRGQEYSSSGHITELILKRYRLYDRDKVRKKLAERWLLDHENIHLYPSKIDPLLKVVVDSKNLIEVNQKDISYLLKDICLEDKKRHSQALQRNINEVIKLYSLNSAPPLPFDLKKIYQSAQNVNYSCKNLVSLKRDFSYTPRIQTIVSSTELFAYILIVLAISIIL